MTGVPLWDAGGVNSPTPPSDEPEQRRGVNPPGVVDQQQQLDDALAAIETIARDLASDMPAAPNREGWATQLRACARQIASLTGRPLPPERNWTPQGARARERGATDDRCALCAALVQPSPATPTGWTHTGPVGNDSTHFPRPAVAEPKCSTCGKPLEVGVVDGHTVWRHVAPSEGHGLAEPAARPRLEHPLERPVPFSGAQAPDAVERRLRDAEGDPAGQLYGVGRSLRTVEDVLAERTAREHMVYAALRAIVGVEDLQSDVNAVLDIARWIHDGTMPSRFLYDREGNATGVVEDR